MKVKLCGTRRIEDIGYMNEFHPDYAGFILSEGFRRTVNYSTFLKLKSNLDAGIKTVGVFVNEPIESILKNYADKLDAVQLHGDESQEYIDKLRAATDCEIWRAVRVRTSDDILKADICGADKLVLDSFSNSGYGGLGKTADWSIINSVKIKTPFFLAGGINADNISDAVTSVDSYGIDISSGVETDGVKDREKIKYIMNLIRSGHVE